MKKFFVLALSAMMVAAFAVPSMAKVNLSGALWVTYWAQQEGAIQYQRGAGVGPWTDINEGVPALVAAAGNARNVSKKTFLVGQSMLGNGTQAKAVQGDGLLLALDCPVNDWVKAYAEFDANSGAAQLTMEQGYINLAFMKEFNVRAGLQNVPFGLERGVRPTVGQEEVFVSDYTQQASGILLKHTDVGVQAYGSLANNMVDYNLFVGNGDVTTSRLTDDNDAKQLGANVNFKPFTGANIGGAYMAGDYNVLGVAAIPDGRAKFTAYDVNASYEYGNIFAVSGEYARSTFDKAAADYNDAAQRVSNRSNEYILKALYTGVADWEFGARYGVVDPKNLEAEQALGFSNERKLSFAAAYKFARAATLKAEYSLVDTDFNYITNYVPGAALIRQNPTQDINDDVFALSLGLQF